MEVFALGGTGPTDDASQFAYCAVRIAVTKARTEAAGYIAARGLAERAPVVVRLTARIATRFDVVASEKLAAQAVPAVGPASGAALKLLFVRCSRMTASGHHTVRRLERTYGLHVVKAAYEAIARSRRDRQS